MGEPSSSAREAPQLEVALERQRRSLFDFIRRRIDDVADAEDVLQEVLLTASERIRQPIDNLTAWLFTVARNKVTDWYRRRRPLPSPRSPGREPGDPQEGGPAGRAEAPDRAYWRAEFWSELADALGELPAEQREVFVAHEIDGLSFKEIAGRTGESINTLLSRKHYAVLFLRERLQDLHDVLDRP